LIYGTIGPGSGSGSNNWTDETESVMEKLVMLAQAGSGLGVFFMGLAALWFVSIYQSKSEKG
jgi:hypothetical protein